MPPIDDEPRLADVSALLDVIQGTHATKANGTSYEASERAAIVSEPKAPPDTRPAIERLWKPMDVELLFRQPPNRNWLLRHPTRDGHPCAPCAGDGLLPRGKAGVLVAEGGVGKTVALIALAVCVVTGRPWLGHFHVERTAGKVLLLLGEEDPEEVHRRLYNVAEALELDAEERQLVAERVVVLPLAGEPAALLAAALDGRSWRDSVELVALRKRLIAEAGPEGWALIVVDPLSRFAGPDTEGDNAAATAFVQRLESLTSVPGDPSVLAAHHSSKQARRTGSVDSRGVTAITDGARWAGTLRAEGADVFFRQDKSNYSLPMPDELLLTRGPGGLLRVPGSSETAEREARAEERAATNVTERDRAKDARYKARLADWAKRLVAVATVQPMSARELAALSGISRNDAPSGVAVAVADGRLVAGWPIKGCLRYALSPLSPIVTG